MMMLLAGSACAWLARDVTHLMVMSTGAGAKARMICVIEGE